MYGDRALCSSFQFDSDDLGHAEMFVTVTTKVSSFSAAAVGKSRVSKGKYFL
jgi:hypothetical protein